jgi:hypothetical protein
LDFKLGDLVAQHEAALLEPTQHELVDGGLAGRLVDQRVEVGVFHAELDQSALWRVKVVIHESAIEGMKAKRL